MRPKTRDNDFSREKKDLNQSCLLHSNSTVLENSH